MKRFFLILFAVMASVGAVCAQTENPRGIYMLKSILVDGIEVTPPFDQYKICTDSLTLMVAVQENQFSIEDNDHMVFNYTGEALDAADPKKTRIFNSSADKFSLKWWSTRATALFPKDDWCTENYVANTFSSDGKKVFNIITCPPPQYDKKNPLYGTWHMVETVDELKDAKELCKELKRKKGQPSNEGSLMNITAHAFSSIANVGSAAFMGVAYDLEKTDGKTYYQVKGVDVPVEVVMLSPNHMAIVSKKGRITDYIVWERVADTRTPLEIMAGVIKR